MRTFFCFAVAVFLILPLPGIAALSESPEAKECFKKYNIPAKQDECLSKARMDSETDLDALISETVKRIKANNMGWFNGKENASVTSGDIYSRRFMKAQALWKHYRQELCLAVATELDEEAYDYQSFIDQCEINLNRRHTEEINLLGLPQAVE